MAEKKVISTGYEPRPLQAVLHRSLNRFNVVVCHRRFGKTIFAINEVLDQGLRCDKLNPQFAYLAPTYGQVKRVAWDYLKRYASNIPGLTINEAELRLEISRPHKKDKLRIMLLGAESPGSLRGIYLDGVIMDEYAEMMPSVWSEVIRPALSDRKGWAIFIGTVKGNNHFWQLHEYARDKADPEWFTAVYKASETKVIDDSELASARRQMTEEDYEAEYECNPSAGFIGAYFSREIYKAEQDNRIGKFPYDPMLCVDTAWDLGVSDTTAIWFSQTLAGRTTIIDCYEVSGLSIPEIVSDLQRKGYVYGEHLLPHDAKARDLSTGKSIEQLLYTLGLRKIRVIPRVGSKRDSINAAKMIIGKCFFDRENCAAGLKALRNYKRRFDEKRNTFEDKPYHDWSSNFADAFQQLALGIRKDSVHSNNINNSSESGIVAEIDYNPFER